MWHNTRGMGGIEWLSARVCALQFWHKIATVPNPIPIPMSTLVPGYTMDLYIKLYIFTRNTTS